MNCVSTSPERRTRVYTPGRSLSWFATVYSLPLFMIVPRLRDGDALLHAPGELLREFFVGILAETDIPETAQGNLL